MDPELKNKDEIISRLLQVQLRHLSRRGITQFQSRATQYWGDTVEYALKFGFSHYRDLYMVDEFEISNVPFSRAKPATDLVEWDRDKHATQVKEILIKYFDTSTELAESFIKGYDKITGGMHSYQM